MRQLTKEIVILSTPAALFTEMRHVLKKNKSCFKIVEGCYKGELEESFLVELDDNTSLDYLVKVAKAFDQESVLYSDEFRNSELVFTNGTKQSIGTLQAVYKDEALNQDAYTYTNNTYYICK